MTPGRAVDGADHRHFDIQQIQKEMLALPIGLVPIASRASQSPVWRGAWPGEGLTRTGHDDDFIVRVAANIAKCLWKFAVRQFSPLQSPAIGMKRHLEDALAPFHPDSLICPGIVIKACHGVPS